MTATFSPPARWSPVLAIWLCFVGRGVFYSAALPVWEGWDEWSHHAYLEHLKTTGRPPAPGVDRPSREVMESLKAGPVAWGVKGMLPELMSYEEYWALPAERRAELERRQRSLPAEWRREQSDADPIWEAQQPPLYYWLMWPVLEAAGDVPLATRVFVLRVATVLLASLAIPLGCLAMLGLLGSRGAALAVTACVSAMPGLMLDAGRVANEAPVVVLYTLLLMAGLRLERAPGDWRWWLAAGAALGGGLLTKAYFLTAFAPLAVLAGWLAWKHGAERRRVLGGWALAMLLALAVAGWWYWWMWQTTGTLTGQIQTVAMRDVGLTEKLAALGRMNWRQWADTLVVSHVWMGGWSFLQMRAWIYHLCGLVLLLGAVGALARGPRRVAAAGVLMVGPFVAALGYQAMAAYFTIGQTVSNGWYVYAVIFGEAALVYGGWAALMPRRGRRWIGPAAALGACALDVYGMLFWMLPYYHGVTGHLPDGRLQNFHVEQAWRLGAGELLARVAANRPYLDGAAWFVALGAAWLVATLALPVVAWMATRDGGER